LFGFFLFGFFRTCCAGGDLWLGATFVPFGSRTIYYNDGNGCCSLWLGAIGCDLFFVIN
jgi:hypothetical protein